MEMFVNSSSIVYTDSRSPSQSDQVLNFSVIHAASPDGESVSPKPSVCGLLPWIAE
jgi:hypothetical protein